jgi:hypothetical protein
MADKYTTPKENKYQQIKNNIDQSRQNFRQHLNKLSQKQTTFVQKLADDIEEKEIRKIRDSLNP